jgi:mRNA interferase HigB
VIPRRPVGPTKNSAAPVDGLTIFNIGGNKYRLATYVNYRTGKLYIRRVMTHEEYSREDWKKR